MPLPTPESLGLPSRPGGVVPSAPATATSFTMATANPTSTPTTSSTTTASDSTTCAHCSTPPKYTCPRCGARTCSLPCAREHKRSAGCSGVRDPAAFVPLNKISQGTWDADYAWLEERRRQVAAWGEDVTPDEATRAGITAGRGRGRGGKAAPPPRQRKSKLDGLRWAVSEIGADVDLLPDGMARRRTNQSSWNPKSRALNLTVQMHVHLPDEPLVSHPRVGVLPRPGKPSTLRSLLPEHLRERTDLVFALPYHLPRWRERQRQREERAAGAGAGAGVPAATTTPTGGRRFFPLLDPAAPLDTVFHGTAFIEFPGVHVWAAVPEDVVFVPLLDTKRKAPEEEELEAEQGTGKKPRTEEQGGGLDALGDYASDSDDGESGDVVLSPQMAAALGQALVADFGEPTEGEGL